MLRPQPLTRRHLRLAWPRTVNTALVVVEIVVLGLLDLPKVVGMIGVRPTRCGVRMRVVGVSRVAVGRIAMGLVVVGCVAVRGVSMALVGVRRVRVRRVPVGGVVVGRVGMVGVIGVAT